jgi:hypothetical protein
MWAGKLGGRGAGSERPYGTARYFLVFQALRTWLLSERPYGTGRCFFGFPGTACQATIRASLRDGPLFFLVFQALRTWLPSLGPSRLRPAIP